MSGTNSLCTLSKPRDFPRYGVSGLSLTSCGATKALLAGNNQQLLITVVIEHAI